MASDVAQTYENHTKFVPAYHYVAFPIFAINFLWSAYRLVRSPSADTGLALLVAAGLILLFFFARLFALAVQDRVIRLEMRLRMRELLPDDLQPRVAEFTIAQLVSLRFASDAELPTLARKVLDEGLTERKVIKQLIRDWQPDLARA